MCPSNKHVKEILLNDSDSQAFEDEQTYIGSITAKKQSTTRKRKAYEVNSMSEDCFFTLEVNGTKTKFKIDSGSQVNIPRKSYYQLKIKPGLKPTRTKLKGYNGNFIPVLGKCAVHIPHKNNTYDVPIIVADTDASSILGLKTSAHMHLIKILNNSKGEPVFFLKSKDCLGKLWTLPGYYHIKMDPNIKPILNPPHKVPFVL